MIQNQVSARRDISVPVRWQTLAVMLGLFLLGLGVFSGKSFLTGTDLTSNDFTADYVSATEWREDGDPYGALDALIAEHMPAGSAYQTADAPDQTNVHPPLTILLIAPLTFLPYTAARTIWMIVNAVAVVVAIYWTVRKVGLPAVVAWSIAVSLLALPLVQSDLRWGQWNGITLLLLVGTWLLARQRLDTLAGISLGLAIALRLFPVLVVVALVAARRWRLARTSLVAAASLSVAGAVMVGWEDSLSLIDHSSSNLDWWYSFPGNLSLVMAPMKLLTGRWASFDVGFWANVLAVLALVLCILGAWWAGKEGNDERVILYSLPWALLASPLLWEHYLILLVPMIILSVRGWRRYLIAVRVVLGLAMLTVMLVTDGIFTILQVFGDVTDPWTIIGGHYLITIIIVMLAAAAPHLSQATTLGRGDRALSAPVPLEASRAISHGDRPSP